MLVDRYLCENDVTLCIGRLDDASHHIDEGAKHLKWGAEPDQVHFEMIRSIYLYPPKFAYKRRQIPEFIAQFKNLEFLYLPVSLLAGLSIAKDLAQLKTIFLWNSEDDKDIVNTGTVVWPEGLVLPALKELKFYNAMGSVKMQALTSMTDENLPNLERFAVTMDLDMEWLKVINNFKSLKALELEHFKDFDVLSHIPLDLTELTLAAAGKNFPFSNLKKFRQLNYIWLNSIAAEIDCGVFAYLPQLQQLNVINSKRIVNPQELLKCKQLEKMRFTNCKQPFNKALKEELGRMGIAELDIKWS